VKASTGLLLHDSRVLAPAVLATLPRQSIWLAERVLWAAHADLASCRVSAEIDFNGSKLLERYMGRQDVSIMKARFKLAASSQDDAEFAAIMKAYGTEVVSLVGAEVRATHARRRWHVT
jgi:hypothetical protein